LNKALLAALAALVALAALAAGCGGGDDTTDESVTLTKTEFIKQGDAICKEGNKEIGEGFEEYAEEKDLPENQEPSKEQGVEITETLILPNVQQQAEEIRELGAPEGEEEQVDELITALEDAVAEGEEDPESLFKGKTDPFGKVNKLAKDFGFKVCGEE
jgi:phosphoenolpyruvate synthase/pyruvate phosphate dikinase